MPLHGLVAGAFRCTWETQKESHAGCCNDVRVAARLQVVQVLQQLGHVELMLGWSCSMPISLS